MAFNWGIDLGIGDILSGFGNLLTGKAGAQASQEKTTAQLLKDQLAQSQFTTKNLLPLQQQLMQLQAQGGQDAAQRQRSLDPVNAQALMQIMRRLQGKEQFGGMNALNAIQRFKGGA